MFWCHSDSLTNGTKNVHGSEGTERCLVFMGPRLRLFCMSLLD